MWNIENILKKSKAKPKVERICIIDFTRGLAIIVMVLFHMFFTFSEVFGFPFSKTLYLFFDSNPIVEILAGLFILISGISSSLTSSNIRRGIRTLSVALGITLVTSLIMPVFGYEGLSIYFGVLHLLGLAMIISPLFLWFTQKVPRQIGLPLCLLLLLLTRNIGSGYIGLNENLLSISLTDTIMNTSFLFPFGIRESGFYSADYYPIFPWIFLFICGVYVGRQIKKTELPPVLYKPINRPIEWLGQRTLSIYVLHQPIIFLLGLLIEKLTLVSTPPI